MANSESNGQGRYPNTIGVIISKMLEIETW